MRTWIRFGWRRVCGQCDREIVAGEPVMEIQLRGLRRRLLRCVGCAGEEPPDGLPELQARLGIAPQPKQKQPLPFSRFAKSMLPIDVKQKASGE